jgi:hypothetical protein
MAFQQTSPQRVSAARKGHGEFPEAMLAELLSKYVEEASYSRQACGGPFFSSWDLEIKSEAESEYNAKSWKYHHGSDLIDDMDTISTAVPSRQTTTGSTFDQGLSCSTPGSTLLSFPPGLDAPSLLDFLPPPELPSPVAPVTLQFSATPGPAPPGLLLPAPAAPEAPAPETLSKPGSWLLWHMSETFSSLMHSDHCRPEDRTLHGQSDAKTGASPQIPHRRPDVQHKRDQTGLASQSTLTPSAEIKFCTQCGEKVPSIHSFCMFCGGRKPLIPTVANGL